jgi:hypothetical protein
LADGDNYIKKKKASDKLHIPHVEALDGIKFEWKVNQEQKGTLMNVFMNSKSTRTP